MKREMFLALVLLGLTVVAEENLSRKEDFKPVKIGELDLSSEFQKFLSGDPKSAWKKISWMNKPEGSVEAKESKLFLQPKGAEFTGIYMALPAASIFSVTPGQKIRMTVTAKGTGRFGYWAYGVTGYIGKACTGSYVSGEDMKKHTAVFTVGKGVKKITPYITAAKKGSLIIESVQIEAVR